MVGCMVRVMAILLNFKKVIVEKVCKLSKAMIRGQNEEKLKVYCKGGQENNEFQASLWN